jgi:hypothetical protein
MWEIERTDEVAVLLIGGDKRGKKDFYDIMIPAAEKLYDKYLKGRYQNENKK